MSSVDILVPDLPESVTDATVATWHKKPGDSVQRNEVLVEIETDKVVLEIPAPEAGILKTLLEDKGAIVTARQVLGRLHPGTGTEQAKVEKTNNQKTVPAQYPSTVLVDKSNDTLSPIIQKIIVKHDINPKIIKDNNGGRSLTNKDIKKHIHDNQQNTAPTKTSIRADAFMATCDNRSEKRVPMTRLRKRIAERMLEAKNSTAMLTTFNDVNMQPVIDLRKQYGHAFEKRHGIRLSFMSFYIKAVFEALKRFPEVNASIDGEDIVYHNYFDISIAISTHRGLVTPVLKNIDILDMANIEKKIKELTIKSRNGKLKVEELTGGSFTITNGGVFGSLMSTPIINPPQSAILGMHAIKDRPMAVGGHVVILPMMYLALSYDHRLIDGKESISFLVTVKEMLEDPIRLLLDV